MKRHRTLQARCEHLNQQVDLYRQINRVYIHDSRVDVSVVKEVADYANEALLAFITELYLQSSEDFTSDVAHAEGHSGR